MKPTATTQTGNTKKADENSVSAPPPAGQWPQGERRADAPAPPPVWTRYVDSRLKQFCTR